MRVMGIDSSTKCTGWAVIDTEANEIISSGTIKPRGDTIERIMHIAKELCKIYREYEPIEVKIEDLSVTRNARTAKILSGLLYVIITRLYEQGAIITLLRPAQWRKDKIKGRNREELKQAAIQYIFDKYGFYEEEDAAEAVIIAEWGS